MGIEPTQPAWKAGILPLNNTRLSSTVILYHSNLALSIPFLIFLLIVLVKNRLCDFVAETVLFLIFFLYEFAFNKLGNFCDRNCRNSKTKGDKILSKTDIIGETEEVV